MMTTTTRTFRWLPLAAAMAMLAGCANGFNPSLGIGVGFPILGPLGVGGSVSVPLGGGAPSVGVGIGAGGRIGNVGIGGGIGGSTTLGTPQPARINQPPAAAPQAAGGQTPAEWSPVQPGAVQPAAPAKQAPAGSGFANWPWGVQQVPAQ